MSGAEMLLVRAVLACCVLLGHCYANIQISLMPPFTIIRYLLRLKPLYDILVFLRLILGYIAIEEIALSTLWDWVARVDKTM